MSIREQQAYIKVHNIESHDEGLDYVVYVNHILAHATADENTLIRKFGLSAFLQRKEKARLSQWGRGSVANSPPPPPLRTSYAPVGAS